MPMVRMRLTDSAPERTRRKYKTRMLTAEGDFEVASSNARILRRIGWAEDAPVEVAPPAPRRRGRPPKAKPEPEAEPLEDKTVPKLREMAKEQGVDLPSGYVRHDALVDILKDAETDQGEEQPLGQTGTDPDESQTT